MAKRSPLQASSTMRTCARQLSLALALLVAAGSSLASDDAGDVVELSPYSAQYKTTALGMKIDLTRSLKRAADGTFTLTSGGKLLVVRLHEVSVFSTEGSRVIPKSYVYQMTGLANRKREVHFTPGSDTIRSLYKDQWYNLPYTDETLDRLSQQEQLRLFLLNDPTPKEDMQTRVADGKRVKDYRLVYVGEETIDTPAGKIDTLHFERLHDDPDRKSDTWVAPDLDYLMVKTVHIEDGKPTEVLLTGGTIDGRPITGQ
jgi:hypothetical protein